MKTKIVRGTVVMMESGVAKAKSYQSIINKVSDALNTQVRIEQNSTNVYTWVCDLYGDSVVYSISGEYFQRTYTIDGDAVAFGAAQEVELSYTPVQESVLVVDAGKLRTRVLVSALSQFQESYDATKGELTITIIQPGFNKGKDKYYPADVLKRDMKCFEGAKMFADHQTDQEARTRPENSVHNYVASITKVWSESDGSLKGMATVIDPPFKAKLATMAEKNLLPEMGVSIRAIGVGMPRNIEGTDTTYVESIVRAKSVDFVTYAGAGGRVEVMEADSEQLDVDLITEAQLRERRGDLVQLIEANKESDTMKTVEQRLQEAEALAKTEKERADGLALQVAESAKTAKKASASTELTKLLQESKLPEAAQTRIKKQFEAAESTDGMQVAIDSEKEYVKSLSNGRGVQNLGEADATGGGNGDEEGAKKQIHAVESWKRLGLTEDQAKIAAAGR